uniref:Uncharacterized protein n=1 Tax=Solanum tuberosum TaxID=4113 RepID=M0ZIK4_SOLTU
MNSKIQTSAISLLKDWAPSCTILLRYTMCASRWYYYLQQSSVGSKHKSPSSRTQAAVLESCSLATTLKSFLLKIQFQGNQHSRN